MWHNGVLNFALFVYICTLNYQTHLFFSIMKEFMLWLTDHCFRYCDEYGYWYRFITPNSSMRVMIDDKCKVVTFVYRMHCGNPNCELVLVESKSQIFLDSVYQWTELDLLDNCIKDVFSELYIKCHNQCLEHIIVNV